jgi:anti-sigma factor RsiW
MIPCEQFQTQITFYLDDELHGPEVADFEAHADACADCRTSCEQERMFLTYLRESGPLQTAGPELRRRVTDLLEDTPPPVSAPPRLRRNIERLWPSFAPAARFGFGRLTAMGVVAACVLFAVSWLGLERRGGQRDAYASDFVQFAVETHLQRQRGQLPLGIVSDSPELVSAWFAGKVPFSLRLPNYEESAGREKPYHLEGAQLIAFHNAAAAHIAYRLQNRPITLVATSMQVAESAGRDAFVSKGRTFHHTSVNGLNVLTWQDHGLTYALVSDLGERGQRSCVVCHAGEKDRGLVEGLRHSS